MTPPTTAPAAVLLAAAALASLPAGGAAAQGLDLSGYARFGLTYAEGATDGYDAGAVSQTRRFRLDLRTSVRTDFGARLEARLRAQGSNGAATTFNAPRFTVSGGGLSVQLGNISGAFDDTPGLQDIIGLTQLGAPDKAALTRGVEGWDTYASTGAGPAANNGLQLGYAAAGFRAALSYSDRTATATDPRRRRLAGHVAYEAGAITAALGFQDSDLAAEDYVLATLGAQIGLTTLTLQAADNRGVRKAVVQATHALTAQLTLSAFLSDESGNPAASQVWDGTGGGVGVGYALGGGADVKAGAVRRSDGVVLADAGVIFRF